MTYKRFARVLLYAVVMVAVFAAAAFAEGQGGEEAAGFKDWMWHIINFAVVAALLAWVYVKFIKGMLKKRIDDVETALAEAKAAREEALRRLAGVEAKLKDKDRELKSILDVALESGQKEKALLIKESERMGADIAASARENIDAELLKAREALRREAALLAIELAEKMVMENIKKEDQARILGDYLAKVGGK